MRKTLLKNLATISYGKSPKQVLSQDGTIPVIGTGGIERLGNDYLFDGESIVVGRKGTIDKPIYIDGKFWAIDTTFYLHDFRETSVKWLYYFLNTINFRSMSEATGVPSLSRDFLYSIKVPTLDKHEQDESAAVLSSIDKAIEQTEKLIAKQQRIKRGLLQDLLTKGIDEHGTIRSDATHEFKDSLLGRIPKEWDVYKLDDIKESITSGSRGWAKYYSPEGDIFLRIGNLTRENIDLRLENIIRVTPPQGNEGIRTALQKDDVLISITADLGMIGIIPEGFGKAYVNQHIALVRLNQEKVFPRWVAYYLASHAGQQQFEKLNESGAKAGLNLPTVISLLVAVPKRIEEQIIVSHLLDEQVSMIDEEEINRNKLESIKTGLMQDLLTGKIRVSNEQTN